MYVQPAIKNLAAEVLHFQKSGRNKGWSVGSGFVVRDRYVLTAAHNVGPGELIVRIDKSEYEGRVLLNGLTDPYGIDLAIVEIANAEADAPGCLYGRVDRSIVAHLEPCWAVGFPRYKERKKADKPSIRNSAQVTGTIPTAENLEQELLTLQVKSTPGPLILGQGRMESQWAGMSGSVVFFGEIVVGVIRSHHLPEGASSLDVVPIAAINNFPNADDWWQILGAGEVDLVDLPVEEWEANLLSENPDLQVWSNRHFRLGFEPRRATDEPLALELGESVNLTVLREGRLAGLQDEFLRLGNEFDQWIKRTATRKRQEVVRLFWIVGEPGFTRSKALLACLARGGLSGRSVYDAGSNLESAAKAFTGATQTKRLPSPPIVGLDLDEDEPEDGWRALKRAANRASSNLKARADRYSLLDDPYPRLVIAGTASQGQAAHDILQPFADMTTIDKNGRHRERPHSFHGLLSMETSRLGEENVYNRGLPITTRRLFGRDDELGLLRRAWEFKRTRVFCIVASGGTGKSALVNAWLHEMRQHDYLGAEKVFAWSFYSQGTKDNLVSADPFVNTALEWLGDSGSIRLNPWAKGRALARHLIKRRFLLILDGLEPLQHPLGAPHVGGRLTDDSVRALLEELSESYADGLCVLTTRVAMTDLERFETTGEQREGSVDVLPLDNLDSEDGVALLKSIIQAPADEDELLNAVEQVDCHALAINLLGNYIRDVHNGDLKGIADLERLMVDPQQGGHARRIMASYIRWLEEANRTAELALLFLIGLFDRPATRDALLALVNAKYLSKFTHSLDRVDSAVWKQSVAALRGMGLLNNALPSQAGVLDAHPLVREHFRSEIENQDPEFWLAGNKTLYEYYSTKASDRPVKAKNMTLLYSAVSHGCAAQQHQEVFEDVLLKRVWRSRRIYFSTRRLGMIGSDLVALSNYFSTRWTSVLAHLPARTKVLVMTNAGVRLRQLGRLADARDCFGSVLTTVETEAAGPEDFEDGSYAAAQYCELLVIAGLLENSTADVDSAVESGQRAIQYADVGDDPYFQMHARSSLAEAYFMLGNLPRALALFAEAQEIDHYRHPRPPFLYSQTLFRYGYYLIETGRALEIVEASGKDNYWGRNRGDSSLLSEAIRLLIIGAAYTSAIESNALHADLCGRAEIILDDAINAFRTAGYADYLVRGLIERAHFFRVRGGIMCDLLDYSRSLGDLERAAAESKDRAMDLLFADVVLERAATYTQMLSDGSPEARLPVYNSAKSCITHVLSFIETVGYKRREKFASILARRIEELAP
jgi:tetratricopeptide (TPR) repeat protein